MWANDSLVVSHQGVGDDGTAPLGYLYVDTRRHVATFDELTLAEVREVAQAVWAAGRALRVELAPENVFSAIIGRGVPHFHQHVFVRPLGVPDDVGWFESLSWPGVARGDTAQIAALCARLGRHCPR